MTTRTPIQTMPPRGVEADRARVVPPLVADQPHAPIAGPVAA